MLENENANLCGLVDVACKVVEVLLASTDDGQASMWLTRLAIDRREFELSCAGHLRSD